jgi:stearoyl-CoA desaturase (delta-9 desaturase)
MSPPDLALPGAPVLTAARRLERRVAVTMVVVPTVGFALAVAASVHYGPRSLDFALCAGMYLLTMLGITGGYHRHFTHRAFLAPTWVRAILGMLGSMAGQGPVLFWVAAHRRHHQHADRPADPHSPLHPPEGKSGFWHAHMGWMFEHTPEDWARAVPDLLKDDLAMQLNFYYPALVLVGLLLPTLVGGLATGRLDGALTGFLWGGLARLFLVHHATWLVNSWCHWAGDRPHNTPDSSTNAWGCALLTLGEGWHNNHHASQASARHGQGPRQPDPTYWMICALARLGLAYDVRREAEPTRNTPEGASPAVPTPDAPPVAEHALK